MQNKPPDASIYIENFKDDTPQLLLALVDSIADKRLRICLDTGHANCNSAVPAEQWIKVLGKSIGHAHLHNNDGIADRHWPLRKGTLDFGTILDCFATYTPDIDCVLECKLSESIPVIAHWL